MSTNPTSITSPHHKVTVLTKRRPPTVTHNPLLLTSLTHHCYRVIERLLRTVAECSRLEWTVGGQLTRCYHGCNGVALGQLILNGLTVIMWEDSETQYFVFFVKRVFNDVFSAGKGVAASFWSVGVCRMLNQTYPHCILIPFGNIALLAAIDIVILTRTVY
jgi:hypothetical protein